MTDLYKTILSLCKNKNITGYRLCKDIGIQPSIITDLKSGRKKSLSAAIANKIASYFGVPVSYLLGSMPFTYWAEINKDRKNFLRHVKVDPNFLKCFWNIDITEPEKASEKNFISFVASNIEEATPLVDGIWVIKQDVDDEDFGGEANTPTVSGERMTDEDLKFALWGGADDITEEDLEDVRRYAAFVRARKKENK